MIRPERKMKKYCFGIDVGGTTVKCGLFTTKGELLEKWEIPTRTELNGSQILPDIAASVNAKIAEKSIDKADIEGLGIDIPGPVKEDGVVEMAVNLHWGHIDIVGEMQGLTGLKCCAVNDANAAALGELWKGGAEGYHNMVMVTLGTGVGGGIVINDRVIAGTHGAGGEIGHANVVDDMEFDSPCNCGNTGCLEQVCSATGIVFLAKKELRECDDPSVLRQSQVTAKAVWDAVKAGDDVADRIAEKFGKYLGRALAIFACVVDPQIFVIGGGVSKAGPILLDYVRKYYIQFAFPACKTTEFALATLGNDAGIYGAAKMVLD